MRWLRTFVGSAPLIMTCTAACIRDEAGRVLLMRRGGEVQQRGDLAHDTACTGFADGTLGSTLRCCLR
jgi:hypothetical protein